MKIETTRLQMILAHIRTDTHINLTGENREIFTSIILELIKARHVQEDLIELLKSADDKIEKLEWKLMFENKDKIVNQMVARKMKEGKMNEKNSGSQEEE
ncbi:hypothetical protein X915_gp115 [Bacillus phage vB_BanS-Tsamsa]|uniref:Uncharacterized protein n=1 Tax=Bacillus phage vB_BanS-Tsamsa TaxID=1308863 RepID=U5J9R3_9CAUD|nr:hypothetical protein X915_gp115 [Bacillus phage vB_BanS-Tsamsa]AGI11881.1 hypothetical protein [Bacillus phage vB_BanS-Tsamsa]